MTVAAIDARLGRRPSGIGQYVYNLAASAGALEPDGLVPVCHRRQLRRFARYGLAPVVAEDEPWTAVPAGVSVIHGPNFHAPRIPAVASVATIHDLGYIEFPECHPPGMPQRLDGLVRAAIPHTERFICVSQDTLDAFVDHYDVPPDRCDLVPHGVDTSVFGGQGSSAASRAVRARFRLTRPFVLFVGALVPRKDVMTLLAAFTAIADDFPDLDLVIAGHKTKRWASDWPKVRAWLEEHRALRRRVRVLNYVPGVALPHLYRASAVVALPSLTEGFGLTVLEGFACGRPVVASRAGAIPEVGGSAAYYAQPRDVDGFAAALTSALLGEDAEARRRDAEAIVARHPWSRTWRATRDAYERAVG